MKSKLSRCPHADVMFCPLYEASHEAGLGGCDDGHLDEGSCGVARGLSYSERLGHLMAIAPAIVARNKWAEEAAAIRAQRTRNQRLNGIH